VDKPEVVLLLTLAGTYDYRKVGDADVEAWHLALDDIDFDYAKAAVVAHYRNTRDRLMPADVRQGVKAIKDERRRAEKHATRALPSRFEEDLGRDIAAERGQATVREVLAQFTDHLAEKADGKQVSALDELRAITAGPDWAADNEEANR
jgi:hypothetical protein